MSELFAANLNSSNSGNNSLFRAIMLDDEQQKQNDLAERISDANRSEDNLIASITRSRINEHEKPAVKGETESLLEEEIELFSFKKLLKEIDSAKTPEELQALLERYEQLLASWKEKIVHLKSEKHLKEYFAIIKAIELMQRLQRDEQLNQTNLSSLIRQQVISSREHINDLAGQTLRLNLHFQRTCSALLGKLGLLEQMLLGTLDAMMRDPNANSPEMQAMIRSLQDSIQMIHNMVEALRNGVVLDLKQCLSSLQQMQHQLELMAKNPLLSVSIQSLLQQSISTLNDVQLSMRSLDSLQQSINARMEQLHQSPQPHLLNPSLLHEANLRPYSVDQSALNPPHQPADTLYKQQPSAPQQTIQPHIIQQQIAQQQTVQQQTIQQNVIQQNVMQQQVSQQHAVQKQAIQTYSAQQYTTQQHPIPQVQMASTATNPAAWQQHVDRGPSNGTTNGLNHAQTHVSTSENVKSEFSKQETSNESNSITNLLLQHIPHKDQTEKIAQMRERAEKTECCCK